MTRGLKRITLHWTGGAYKPNAAERKAYHFLIDGNGRVHDGDLAPEANITTRDGVYARHCGGLNTGNIGVGICAMGGSKVREGGPYGDFPPREIQFDAAVDLIAQLCDTYKIPVREKTVFNHSEVRGLFGVGRYKWDINYMPWKRKDLFTPPEAGAILRAAVSKKVSRGASGRWLW